MNPTTSPAITPDTCEAPTKRRPSQAIATKVSEAHTNRQKIADAIVSLQKANQPINVKSTAAAAKVSTNTIRRNPDLLNEVIRLRDHQTQGPPARHAGSADTASKTELKARMLQAQSQVVELRRELALLAKQTYQAIGLAAGKPNPDDIEWRDKEIARLRIDLANNADKITRLQRVIEDLQADYTDAQELARERLQALDNEKNEHKKTRQRVGLRNLRAVTEPVS